MGRIDEALRRSNVDASAGTGVSVSAPDTTPWRFEQHEDRANETAGEEGRPMAGAGLDVSRNERLVVAEKASPLLVEQFRGLAAALLADRGEQPLRSLIVTSATPGDGKSHVAVNLALTLSESYRRRVLLVDADLRRPSLHKVFGVPNSRGLSEALRTKSLETARAVRLTNTFTLLPAGRPDPNHLGDLSSGRMKAIVADAASMFEWVIIDSPPVGVLADARVVADTVDGALLVVRAGVTRFPDLKAAADTIGHERILGLILNAVEPGEIRGEGYYRHYYDPQAANR